MRAAVDCFNYCVAENRRSNFHRPDFVDHDQSLCAQRFADRLNANRLQGGKIETVLSDALRRLKIDMSEHSFFAIEGDELKPDTRAVLTHLFGIKTAGSSCQTIDHALDQCRLAATGPACKQNFSRSHHRRKRFCLSSSLAAVLKRAPNSLRSLQSDSASACGERSSRKRCIRMGTSRAEINSPVRLSSSRYMTAMSLRNFS